MWPASRVSVLFIAMQAARLAFADGSLISESLLNRETPNHVLPRINYLNLHFLPPREFTSPIQQRDMYRSTPEFDVPKAYSEPNAPTGLHWTMGNQRPALEYRLNDNNTVHFHFSKHGAMATSAWSF